MKDSLLLEVLRLFLENKEIVFLKFYNRCGEITVSREQEGASLRNPVGFSQGDSDW